MTRYRVVLDPAARDDIAEIEDYIARQGGPRTAVAFVDRLLAYLDTFETSPERGSRRDDLGKGLRVTNFEGRITVLFSVEKPRVLIARVAWGGRPIEHVLQDRT
jgi:plasmid stabilization system protein ParE